jgi:hypothetical protein
MRMHHHSDSSSTSNDSTTSGGSITTRASTSTYRINAQSCYCTTWVTIPLVIET